MFSKKAVRKIVFLMVMLPGMIIAFSWVYNVFFVEIDTSGVDGYYDLLLKYGKPSGDLILDLGVGENDDLQIAVDRIKSAMGLKDYKVWLDYHDGKEPPAYIENKIGLLTIYFSRDVKRKKEQINVLTHELGHIYVWGLDDSILEGCDKEKVVDTTGPFLGLGILVLNGLTDSFFYLPGGEYRTEKKFFGYITPAQFGYLVARYCAEHGIAEENVTPFLTHAGRKYFTMGCNYLARQNTVVNGSADEITGAYWCPECGCFTRVSLANKIKGLKCPECSWKSGDRFNFFGTFFTTSALVRPACVFLNEKSVWLVSALSNIEHSAFFFINRELANPALDTLIIFLMKIRGEFIIILIGIAAFFAGKRYLKFTSLIFFSSYVIARYAYKAIKFVIKRPRPFETLDGVRLVAGSHGGSSFPSGHATISFCLATVVAMRYPKMRYPAFIIAILVALSRPYLGFHYLSDISAGAILGIFVGYVATKTANACERKRK